MVDQSSGSGEPLDLEIDRLEDALRALRSNLNLSEADIQTYIRVTRSLATPSDLESVPATGSTPPTMWPPRAPWPCGASGGRGGGSFDDIGA